jgi:parallel beta-helix repeat protein
MSLLQKTKDGIEMNSIKKPMFSCLLILLFFGQLLFIQGTAQEETGNEYYVDSSYKGYSKGTAEQPFKTIQDAIDYAIDGDTIYVFGGTYDEHIIIDKQLHLWGGVEGKESIIELEDDIRYTVEIRADGVEFQDFWLTDEHEYKSSPIGSLVSIQAENVVITGNTFNNSESYGIHIDDNANGAIISGNEFMYLKKGIDVSSATNDIVNNIILNCSDKGIYLFSTSHNRLYDNQIDNCMIGIHAESCTYINISNNSLSGNEYYAIQLSDCTKPIIKFNEISENPSVGIYMDSDQGTIDYNTFFENNRGISLKGTSNIIYSNTFTSNTGAGIYTLSTSQLNTIYNNTFESNGKTAEEHGDNTWYHEIDLRGNYWDDYNWLDRNKDGIGDLPYERNGIYDPYPLGFFLKEPEKPSDPSPDDGETGVGLKLTLKVKVIDEDSDELIVTFFNAATNQTLGVDKKITSGKYATWDLTLPFDRTYAWYAIVNDSYQENVSDTFFFTTMVTPPDNIPPIADIGGPYEGGIGEPIQFDASASSDEDGEIDFYRWNFGDGTSELLAQSPLHTYDSSGTYTVTLTVIDNLGSVDTKTILIPIGVDANKPPSAEPQGPYFGTAGTAVVFDGTESNDPDGEITEYLWSFGDDTTGTGATISHTYQKKGSYLVVLTVTDAFGESHAESTTVTIDPKPEKSPGLEFIGILGALIFILYTRKKYLYR